MNSGLRRRKEIKLRRDYESVLTGLTPADVLRAKWHRGRFVVFVETDNGVKIAHKLLTPPATPN